VERKTAVFQVETCSISSSGTRKCLSALHKFVAVSENVAPNRNESFHMQLYAVSIAREEMAAVPPASHSY
jgi:hypothetical protein